MLSVILFCFQKKGWINCEIFSEWMDHFIKYAKPSLENKVLLILDGHKSHTHNIPALQKASVAGVIMLSLPPHTSHQTQPLDLAFFKALKTYYSQNIDQWMRAHPGRAVTMYQVSQLFGPAYAKAVSVSVAINGFRKAGVFPINPIVYEEIAFCPAEATEQPDSSVGDNSVRSTNTDQENDSPLSCENNTEIALHVASAQDTPSENDDDQAEAPKKHKKKITIAIRQAETDKEYFCVVCGESHDEDWIQCAKRSE